MSAKKLELEQLQGLLASGYARQKAACFLLFQIEEPREARKWLGSLLPRITFFGDTQAEINHNIALTSDAFTELGIPPAEVVEFSREFLEGMTTPHRGRLLGDLPGSRSDPHHWAWGGPRNTPVHILLMVYAPAVESLRARLTEIREQSQGMRLLMELPAVALAGNKEHFGFRDGLGQPIVRGLHKPGPEQDTVAPGEFILGYKDESGAPEPAPDLARNGSYLVLRQIVQDVAGFWRFLQLQSGERDPVQLGAKMLGRWPDGTPLTLSPKPPTTPNPTNHFRFRPNDLEGLRCPLGAHIRRANPRDALLENASRSVRIAKRHRLLRRGRAFGLPLSSEVYPNGVAVSLAEGYHDGSDRRGLYFVCLNASLSRQFEFVQYSWINNPKFQGLVHESDPISSAVQPSQQGLYPVFTMQGRPLRTRITGTQKFIHTVGGGYFFLPGRHALQRLSDS